MKIFSEMRIYIILKGIGWFTHNIINIIRNILLINYWIPFLDWLFIHDICLLTATSTPL